MAVPALIGRKVRFGEYELDLVTRELHGPQGKVSLQEQPFQILAAVLERPGQLVTREELTRRLWPTGTFVDFERSLNKAVNRLREALQDSAEEPRFIETLPRRGYRFVGSIQASPGAEKAVHPWPVADPLGTSAKRSRRFPIVAALSGLIFVGLAGLLWWSRYSTSAPKPLNYTQLTRDGIFKDSLLIDGPRLYYRQETADHPSLMTVAAAGGEAAAQPAPFEPLGLHDIYPDGSELLVTKIESGLDSQPGYRLALPGGSAERLGDIVFRSAAWAPDGRSLAYAADSFIFVANRDGSDVRQVASVSGQTDLPRWSPDGKRLRFTVYDRKKLESGIWEVAADGSNPHRLRLTSSNQRRECCGQWTSDGRYFLFLAEEDSGNALWVVREQTRWRTKELPVRLTFGPAHVVSFTSSRESGRAFLISGIDRSEVVRYDPKTKQFQNYPGGKNAFALDFSPDGKQIVYTDPVTGGLWKSEADGKRSVRLTEPGLYALKPRWSPDGSRIAFAGYRGTQLGQAFVIPAEGGTPRRLTDGTDSVGFISWSPDGKTLLVGEWNTALTQDENNRAIHSYFLDLSTGGKVPLRNSAGLYGPQWSPDGGYIFAKSQTDDLRLLDLQTGTWSDLAKGPAEWATWSHDSRSIYFGSVDQGDPVLKRVDVIRRKVEIVANLKELRRRKGKGDKNWLGLGPDDVPLAVRDASTYDVYALDLKLP